MVSRLVYLGIKHQSGAYDKIFIIVRHLRVCRCGALSLTRGRVCLLQLLLTLASAIIFGPESRGTRDHILLSQIQDFRFHHLLRLAGLQWKYSTPPPYGNTCLANSSCFINFGRQRTEHLIQWFNFSYPLLSACLCMRCLGNVHESLPSKMGISVSGSTIPALGGVYRAVFWQWTPGFDSIITAFRRHVTI
jgi:hypothetical protein